MKPKNIDQLAIWLPMKAKGLDTKIFPDGYTYKKNTLLVVSETGKPVIRYAKNYRTENKNYSLCLITHEKDTKKIEKWLDEQAKKIQEADIESKFKLMDVFYG